MRHFRSPGRLLFRKEEPPSRAGVFPQEVEVLALFTRAERGSTARIAQVFAGWLNA